MTVKSVPDRNSEHKEPELGMKSDSREIPDPISGPPPVGHWIAAGGRIQGEGLVGKVTGMVAMSVTKDRLYAIVAPENPSSSAVWISVPRAALRAAGVGQQGVFKKRPASVAVDSGEWHLEVDGVARLFRSSNRAQSAQEQSLLSAIQG